MKNFLLKPTPLKTGSSTFQYSIIPCAGQKLRPCKKAFKLNKLYKFREVYLGGKSMSVMHIFGGIFIGMLVGKIFSAFTLRKLKGGKYTFMGAGIVGSFLTDLLFRFLHDQELVSAFYYQEVVIIFEMIGGAIVACYLANLFGKKESIYF